uniref:Jumonji domain-containing protein 4 n=1 Tax=Amblyomma triste TaxID=251400 RepID=A0A023G8U6_AMBTT
MSSYTEELVASVDRLQLMFDSLHTYPLDSHENVCKVDYLGADVSYDEFFMRYALANKPCILSSHHTSDWKSRHEWVDSTGRPNLEFLKSAFGASTVPVSDCSVRRYDSPSCCDMVFSEYVNYWQTLVESGHDYAAKPCLYLKDWHFTRDFPTYGAYTTPIYFTSDWLNEFWDSRTDIMDDFRFVYMGPKGSWTPLHTDVFKSFSWSANICGKKLWYLFPPRKGQATRGKRNSLPYDIDSLYEQSVQDAAMIPNLPEPGHNPLYLTVIQNPGEIIFVPSHWYHQVHNLDDTISINHNFFNACNVRTVMMNLMAALIDVQEEISAFGDTEGFHEHCQVMLRAHFGMNMADFCKMLEAVLVHRVDMFEVPAEQRGVAYFSRKALVSDIAAAISCYTEMLKLPRPILETASISADLMGRLREKLETLGGLDQKFENALSLSVS